MTTNSSANFSLTVDGISGLCPSGEKWAEENITKKAIPVLSCEGPCVRGEIARLAAKILSQGTNHMPELAMLKRP